MSLFEFLFGKRNKTTANVAKDRLQIIIAQQRDVRDAENSTPDYLPMLQKELMEVLSKYVKIELNNINISHEKRDGIDMLELNITLPEKMANANQSNQTTQSNSDNPNSNSNSNLDTNTSKLPEPEEFTKLEQS